MSRKHCTLTAFPLLFLATVSFDNSLRHLVYLRPTTLTLNPNSATQVPAALALLCADAGTNSLMCQVPSLRLQASGSEYYEYGQKKHTLPKTMKQLVLES